MFIQISFRNCIFFRPCHRIHRRIRCAEPFYCRLLYSGSLPSDSRHRHLYTDGFLMPGRIRGSCRSRLHYPDLERESASEWSLSHCCQARSAYRKFQNHLLDGFRRILSLAGDRQHQAPVRKKCTVKSLDSIVCVKSKDFFPFVEKKIQNSSVRSLSCVRSSSE